MKVIKRAKIKMVWHISQLFKLRFKTSRAAKWDCVIRERKLMLIRAFLADPSIDKIILNCFLKPGQRPSLISIYNAVHKNWDVLSKAEN